jgi:hypothetical protein
MRNIKKYSAKIISQDSHSEYEIVYSISKNEAESLQKILSENHKIKVEYIKTLK